MPVPALDRAGGRELEEVLRTIGLVLDFGAYKVRLNCTVPGIAGALRRVYPHFPLSTDADFVDTHIRLFGGAGVRRWLRPQARFEADGLAIFDPSPRSGALPLFEWGVNWCFANMSNQHLLLHSGVLEIDGTGLMLVAQPGSGKSTLTAALGLSGARVLSDEFGILDRDHLHLLPLCKPVVLKNESIATILGWSPRARLGPMSRNTRKGDVAHLAVSKESTDRRGVPVRPRVVVFPEWAAGAPLSIETVGSAAAFTMLGANSFNYSVLGPEGFDAVAALVEQCAFYSLRYEKLDDAVPAVLALVRDHAVGSTTRHGGD